MRILIIEDDIIIAKLLKEALEDETYSVDLVHDGMEGILSAKAIEYDAIILDLMLPEKNGFEVCRDLRKNNYQTPILMLTARSAEKDIINGLNFGADDYLVKPFSIDVLLAHLRAILRRPKTKLKEKLVVDDLSLDVNNKIVKRGKKDINLTAKEFAVLEFLMRNVGMVKSKDEIIASCWDFEADILPNNVELFIMFLRRKIDKPYSKKLIKTVTGFGYKIEA